VKKHLNIKYLNTKVARYHILQKPKMDIKLYAIHAMRRFVR